MSKFFTYLSQYNGLYNIIRKRIVLKFIAFRKGFGFIMLYQEHNSVGQMYYQNIRYTNFHWEHHMHRHPELLHVIEGSLAIEVNGRVEYATAGEYVLILSNQIHAFYSLSQTLIDVCIFSEDWASAFFKKIQNKNIYQSVFNCSPRISAFIDSELFLCDGKKPDVFMLKSMLYAVLSEFLTQAQLVDTTTSDKKVIELILKYVRENFTDNISLESIAEQSGYNKQYLSRQFHKNISLNFPSFVNLYRVDYAIELLRTSDLPITEIAYKSGFQSIRSFNRVFLKITGVFPKQIRKDDKNPNNSL